MFLRKAFITLSLSFFLLAGLFFYQNSQFNDGKLHVVFCDVGQGDGIFIRTPKGQDILIDGGPDDKILSCLNNHMPFWDKDIELMVLTHPHVDHFIGLIAVLKRYSVLSFASSLMASENDAYKELLRILKEKEIERKVLKQEDKFKTEDGLTLITKWPLEEKSTLVKGAKSDTYFDQNKFSLVEYLSYGKTKILLTADVDALVEDEVAGDLGKIDILKISHHGSKTGTNKEFLETLKPELAVISVGKNNKYNLPYAKTLEVLNDLGIKTLRTDENGEIEIISDGEEWGIKN